MKSILIVIDSLGSGGAEKVLCTYLQHWDKEKYDITIAPIVDGGVYSSEVRAIDQICFAPIIPATKNFFRKFVNKILYKLIYHYFPPKWVYTFFLPKKNDVEIAFCEGFVTKLIANSTNKKAKKIAWIHTDIVNNDWPVSIGVFKNRSEEKHAYSKYDSIIGVSQLVCDSFASSFGLSNINCIYNPLDRSHIKELSCIHSEERTSDIVRLVSVGRLVYDKGFDLLIEALGILLKEGLSFELNILGEGTLRDDLRRLISDNGLEKCVHLMGFRDNPYAFLASSDIYVSSSRYEGFSLAIAEAMIVGLPIVSTKCAGPLELLNNGEYGMLVDCSVESLTVGLREMILKKNVRDFYKEKSIRGGMLFGIDSSIEQTENLFNQ
jgi:glycosyltransferase involved in cell wall biosynthesis